jgi:MFS transporter, SP family, xylose:H+ symportor
MAFIDTSSKSASSTYSKGNPLYIAMLTIVATLGGLLFGYDTAVVNGAEKSLVGFYITKMTLPENLQYAISIISQYRLLMTICLYLIFIIISAQIVRLIGLKKGILLTVAVIAILTAILAFSFWGQAFPSSMESLQNIADTIKGFVIASALIGCIIGGAMAGFISKSLGRKNGLFLAAAAFFISAIGAWKPETFNVFGLLDVYSFVIYRIIGGIGVGLASMISPMYIAEIAPANIRGRLISFNQFSIIFGMLVIYFVNYFIAKQGDEQWLITDGWRLMFLSGAIPAGIFIVLLFFVPETPRFLVLNNKEDKALKVLKKIAGEENSKVILEEIKGTLHEHNAPWLSYGFLIIFVGIMLSVFQQFVGINVVLYYAGNIFRNMGSSTDSSLLQTIIVGAVNLIFTVVAILTVDKFGRKPLMIIGSIGMAISMVLLGFTFFLGGVTLSPGGSIAALIFMLFYTASFAMSWGPVCWVLLAEMFPNSIRGAMSIAVAAQWIANWIVSLTFPMMNDNVWLTSKFNHGFSYWIYGVMGVISAVFIWKMVPETKGKTLEEMEKLWKK